MDELEQLITPDVYNTHELYKMGWTSDQINDYCNKRHRKWLIAVKVFQDLFKDLGDIIAFKDFIPDKKEMCVRVYSRCGYNNKPIARKTHRDPLFALAECAKALNRTDDFLTRLMDDLSLE